jgi:anti-sigma B factor antagonist
MTSRAVSASLPNNSERRIAVSYLMSQKNRGVLVIYFNMPRLIDQDVITDVGRELTALGKKAEEGLVLMNFGNVKYMSSAMLGKLIAFNKDCKKNEVKLKFSNISKDIMEVFTITRMDKLFQIHNDEKDAMAEFEKEGWNL